MHICVAVLFNWRYDNLPTTTTSWCVVNFTSNVYQLCFIAIFLLIPEEPQNEISTACSCGSGRFPQRIWKKSKQRFWRGQRSKYLQRCGSCVLYCMKPYKNSNESPFFMLQHGAFNIKIQSKMAKLQGNK